jgi:hypothetical protein
MREVPFSALILVISKNSKKGCAPLGDIFFYHHGEFEALRSFIL